MQENRRRERVGENAFDPSLRQAFLRVGRARGAVRLTAKSAIHFPRRRISRTAKPFRRSARMTACFLRSARFPRESSGRPRVRWRDQLGNSAIKISLKRFAVMMSYFPVELLLQDVACRNLDVARRRWRAHSASPSAQARGSLSIASTRPGSEVTAGDGENAAARSRVEHAPAGSETAAWHVRASANTSRSSRGGPFQRLLRPE